MRQWPWQTVRQPAACNCAAAAALASVWPPRASAIKPCAHGLADAEGLHRLGAEGHVFGGVLAHVQRAGVQAGACQQRLGQRGQQAVVGGGEAGGVLRGVEQGHQAVAAVDLVAAPDLQQVTRAPVVQRPQRGHGGITQTCVDGGAAFDVGEQQRQVGGHGGRTVAERDDGSRLYEQSVTCD